MSKIEVNKAAEIMKSHEIDPETLRAIIEEMNLATQADSTEGDAADKAPAVKKQFAVLVSDPDGAMNGVPDLVAWVLQMDESESIATLTGRLFRGAYDFNASRKGQLMPVKTVGEAIENVGSRFFKEAGVWVKTKTPVLVLRTDNEIPREAANP